MTKMDEQNLSKQQRRILKKEEKMENRAKKERAKVFKKIALFALLFIIAGGGMFGVVGLGIQSGGQTASLADTFSVNAETEWIRGNPEAKTTLIEYSDFQCPACGLYEPLVQEVIKEYGDKVRLVYRHFPLPQHGEAKLAAYAAEAAGTQGKFWEMHDAIFARQKEWSEKSDAQEKFEKYAQELGLDMEQFGADMGSKEIKDKVQKSADAGILANINATPTFFLNGEAISPRGLDEFKKAIDAVLE